MKLKSLENFCIYGSNKQRTSSFQWITVTGKAFHQEKIMVVKSERRNIHDATVGDLQDSLFGKQMFTNSLKERVTVYNMLISESLMAKNILQLRLITRQYITW